MSGLKPTAHCNGRVRRLIPQVRSGFTKTVTFPQSMAKPISFRCITHHALPAENPDDEYPLVLTTGRVKHHWHTMARTGKNQALRRSAPDPVLELNRVDARRFNIQDADFVEIISRRGKVMAQARVTEEITAGTCFLPFHWGRDEGFFKAANNLTIAARDPVSRQPELKACAVRLRKVLEFP